ncbi:MAG: T9SS type A sorting domain-containing protein [Candidatus Sabulitectum sp.]|nr:T9SS type A sorting domain-containing protein [Candidatus Sabulitectum sp.]
MKALSAVLIVVTAILAEEPPDTLWTVYDDNPFLEYVADGVLTQNDCYAYVGACDSLISLRIFDSTGNEVLSRLYGIPFMPIVRGYSIDQLNDGGFIIAGKSSNDCGVFIRTDAAGDTLWTSIDPDIYRYTKLIALATSDGGYILLYGTSGAAQYEINIKLQKYDSEDNLEWQTVYDEYFQNNCSWIMEEANGSLIVACDVANISNPPLVLLIKFNSDGSELWSRTYGSFLFSHITASDACKTVDGGYCISGYHMQPNDFNSILLKTDADGNEEWRKEYEGTRALQAITSLGNGDLIAGGFANNFTDAFLFRTDGNGETIWESIFGIQGHNYEYAIDILYDINTDHFVVAAVTALANIQPCDYWLLCYNAGTSGFTSEEALDPEMASGISGNYPNPFTKTTVIKYVLGQAGETHLVVYDLAGHRIRNLYCGCQNEGSFEITWDGCDNYGNRAPGGVYFCRFDSNGSVSGHRMILIN